MVSGLQAWAGAASLNMTNLRSVLRPAFKTVAAELAEIDSINTNKRNKREIYQLLYQMVKGEMIKREDMREGQAADTVLTVLECLMVHFSRVWCGCSVVLFSCFPEYPDDVSMYFIHLFLGFLSLISSLKHKHAGKS